MEAWVMWLIIIGIGLVVGFVIHAVVRYAQGSALLATLLAGVVGALLAAQLLTPYVNLPNMTTVAERFLWAIIGGAVLSFIVELSFAGSRQGRVLTT